MLKNNFICAGGTFIFFGCLLIPFAIFVFLFIKETKGNSDIENLNLYSSK